MRADVTFPELVTNSAKDYFISWNNINGLFDFILNLTGMVEHNAQTAHNALIETEHDEQKKVERILEWEKRTSPVEELKKNRQILLETILVRHVENFLNYISSVLFEIFTTRPDTLKSSEKIEISRILEHDSIESLVRELAELKVDSLSYSSFSKLSDYFQEKFKINIATDDDFNLISTYIEIRNISVHERCHINKRFVKRLGLDPSEIGKIKELYMQDLDILIPRLAETVAFMDATVRDKMNVEGISFQ
jgi:hypothetical protein